LVGWLVCWLFGWLVGWLVGWRIYWLIGRLVLASWSVSAASVGFFDPGKHLNI
jgi:hypothetical protein